MCRDSGDGWDDSVTWLEVTYYAKGQRQRYVIVKSLFLKLKLYKNDRQYLCRQVITFSQTYMFLRWLYECAR